MFRRNGGGVDHHERAAGTGGKAVNSAGSELFAGTRRPNDKNAAVGGGHFLDRLTQLVGCRRMPDHRCGKRRVLLEFLYLASQSRVFERSIGYEEQPVGLKRLLDEIVSAPF